MIVFVGKNRPQRAQEKNALAHLLCQRFESGIEGEGQLSDPRFQPDGRFAAFHGVSLPEIRDACE